MGWQSLTGHVRNVSVKQVQRAVFDKVNGPQERCRDDSIKIYRPETIGYKYASSVRTKYDGLGRGRGDIRTK